MGYSRFAVTWLSNSSDDSNDLCQRLSRNPPGFGPLTGIPRSYLEDPYPSGGTYPNPVIQAVGTALGPYQDLGNNWSYYDMRQYKVPINDRFNFNIQRELPGRLRLDATEFMMFEHNAQDGSMWGGFYGQNLNQMNPEYYYKYKGLLSESVPNPFYGQFPTSLAAAGVSSVTPGYTGLPIMPGSLGTSSTVVAGPVASALSAVRNLNSMGSRANRITTSGRQSPSHGPSPTAGRSWEPTTTASRATPPTTTTSTPTTSIWLLWDRRLPRHNIRIIRHLPTALRQGQTYFSTVPKWVDEVIGGWSTSQIFYFMGGDLLSFPTIAAWSAIPGRTSRAGRIGSTRIASPPRPSYTIATAPPYYEGLRGPRFWQLDSTASKNFSINERFNLEFRLEMYNMPNKFIPGDPCVGSSCGSSDGLSLTEAGGSNGANYGRELQGSLRLHF